MKNTRKRRVKPALQNLWFKKVAPENAVAGAIKA
jgi:hypothetical protein